MFVCLVCPAAAGNEWYTLPHEQSTDDQLFEQIVALDRGEVLEGVQRSEAPKDDAPTAAAAEAKA